jgi:hypothetical protein
MPTANLTSTDALAAFKAALIQFAAAASDAVVQLKLEARRPIEWIDHDRAQYWPRQVQRAADAVSEARLALQRCELTIDGDSGRSCYDERKALEKTKRRLQIAEEKVQAVRRWKVAIRKEIEEFEVQAARLQQYLDSDFTRAWAALDRMAAALDQYVQPGGPADAPQPSEPIRGEQP